MPEESIVLKHEAHAALLRWERGDVTPLEADVSRIGKNQSRDNTQQGALTTAARSQQHHELTLVHLETDLVDHLGLAVEGLADLINFELYRHRFSKE